MTRKGLELSRWQTRVDKIHDDISKLKRRKFKDFMYFIKYYIKRSMVE